MESMYHNLYYVIVYQMMCSPEFQEKLRCMIKNEIKDEIKDEIEEAIDSPEHTKAVLGTVKDYLESPEFADAHKKMVFDLIMEYMETAEHKKMLTTMIKDIIIAPDGMEILGMALEELLMEEKFQEKLSYLIVDTVGRLMKTPQFKCRFKDILKEVLMTPEMKVFLKKLMC